MKEVKTRKGEGDSTMFNFPKGSKAKMKKYLDELNLTVDPEFKITMRDMILMGISLIEKDLVPNEILHTELSKYIARKNKQSITGKVEKVLCETKDADGNITGHLVMEYSGKVVPVFFN